MFDAYEAVDELIHENNEGYMEAAYETYDRIFEELSDRVECGMLSLEDANLINEAAAQKYLTPPDPDEKEKKKKKRKKLAIGAAVGAGALGAGYVASSISSKNMYTRANNAIDTYQKRHKAELAAKSVEHVKKLNEDKANRAVIYDRSTRLGKRLINKSCSR